MSSRPPRDIYAETLAIFDHGDDPSEPRTTPEVADALDANRRTVYKRLKTLAERGDLRTKKAGSRARVWWRSVPERSPDGQEHDDQFRALVRAVDEYAIFLLDPDGHVVSWNDGAERIEGYERAEIVGEHVSTFYTDEAITDGIPELNLKTATAEGSIEEEGWRVREDGSRFWAHVTITAVHDDLGGLRGYTNVTRDMTERRERERNLEHSEAIIEAMGDPVYALDAQGRFTFVNQALVDCSGYDEAELVGQSVSIGMDAEDVSRTASVIADLLADDPEETATVEYEVRTKDGERLPVENHISLLTDDDGRLRGTAGVLRDVTERNERERDLEESRRRYRTLVENFPNGVVTLVNDDLQYIAVGGTPIEEVGATIDELEGSSLREVLPPEFADILVPRYIDALDGESSTFEYEFGGRHFWCTILPVRDESGDEFTAMGMSQDITERYEYAQELKNRVRQLEVITDLGQRALEMRDIDALMVKAAEQVAATLDNDYCKVLDLDADAGELLLRHGVGWNDGLVGSTTVSAAENDSQAAYTLASRQPVVVADLETESRFGGPELLASHDVRSGISTVIGPYDDPWGILGTHDTTRKGFSDHDVNFVQAVANVLATAINRHTDEQKLARQRAHLATLDNLNRVGREITDAVIDRSTREEIERAVCEQLTAAEPYPYAWIADVDQRTEELRPRVEAGIENLESIDLSANSVEAIGRGPVGEALRTGTVRVSRDVFEAAGCDHWRRLSETHGFRSFAAIPIVHEDILYGVLGVHSDRAGAFDGGKREIVGQLGEVVGHAIGTVEQKRALLSDHVTELELRIRNIFEAFDPPVSVDGTVTINRAVPIGDGRFLVYGTATEDAIDLVQALVQAESVSHWESVTVLDTDEEGTRFELGLSESPVLSTVVGHGGYLQKATIEAGDCYVKIHLAPSTDVQRVIEGVKIAHPSVEMVTRRQTRRATRSPTRIMDVLSDRLTDRQQVALEAGYFAGFFEWPRERSGEAVAESLEISSSTFHQHLRKAEKELLDAVFATS